MTTQGTKRQFPWQWRGKSLPSLYLLKHPQMKYKVICLHCLTTWYIPGILLASNAAIQAFKMHKQDEHIKFKAIKMDGKIELNEETIKIEKLDTLYARVEK